MKRKEEQKLQIIYQEEPHENHWLDFIWDFCLVFVLQMGVLQFLFAWTEPDNSAKILCVIVTGMCALAQSVLQYGFQRRRYSQMVPLLAIVILLIVRNPKSVYYGMFGTLNYIIGWWNVKQEDAVKLVMDGQITSRDIVSFLLVFSCLLMILAWRTVEKKDVANTMPVPLICAVTGLVIDRFSVVGCSLFFIGWVGIWLSRIRTRASFRRTIWLVVISAILLLVAAFNPSEPMASVKQWKEKAEAFVETIRYGRDTLPEGDLSRAGQLLDGKKKTLKVTTKQIKSLYLRGFVGGRYQDGAWTSLPKSVYKGENNGMLSWLAEADVIPQNQYAAYMKWDKNKQIEENAVTVENVGANRSYVYMPYSAEPVSYRGIQENQDSNYISHALFGKKKYTYTEWSGNRPGELLYADSWVADPKSEGEKTYAEAESVYASFVYENYLTIDPKLEEMIQKEFFDGWEEEANVYYTTEQIRDVLKNKVAYREHPDDVPEGVDPVSWVLNKGHQGNAVMFASIAVLAYRAKGIPARYVEGYFVPEQQLDQNGTLTLTTKNSHAWVEVYLDGVGFIPVDVTPGFYYDTYTLLEMVQKPEKVNRTAAEEESNEDGQNVESEENWSDNSSDTDDRETKRPVYLDALFYVLLGLVLIMAAFEIWYVIWVISFEKKYRRLPMEEQTRRILFILYRLLALYGYHTKPGWNVEETDRALAGEFAACYEGEYVRIAAIIEKNIYGQESLTAAEIRTLCMYTQKLYEQRRQKKWRIRIKCRIQCALYKKRDIDADIA